MEDWRRHPDLKSKIKKKISFSWIGHSEHFALCSKYIQIKDYKVKMFHPRMGWGEGDFLFGLATYRANTLYRDLTVNNSRHPKQEAFWRNSSPTTYIIIVSRWQHHQTKLPMARMFTNTFSLSCKYMISMP
jgi:hypothetical protein